ncbi:hypothetical protein, partial [Brachybacterium phenoliresistens]|uniref:hypothetical protein n=1 Tax=Brachybacterium phenoliresistens TaxID=396014 RepID=UPI0031D9E028
MSSTPAAGIHTPDLLAAGVLAAGVATPGVPASGTSAACGVIAAAGVLTFGSGRVVGIVVVWRDGSAEVAAVLTAEHALVVLVVVHQVLGGHRADQIDIIDHIPDHVMPLATPDQ